MIESSRRAWFHMLRAMQHYTGLLGVLVILAIGYAFSTNRRAINRRTVFVGVGLQIVLTILLFKFPPVVSVFTVLANIVSKVISFADEGTGFLFGNAACSITSASCNASSVWSRSPFVGRSVSPALKRFPLRQISSLVKRKRRSPSDHSSRA